ncbi:hypothetical protein P8917_17040 [Bacillus atrophaeus]|uniref:hypothetical protein n=1 Tax=Bacillus atrophaeus TaxID=1452 RepID=UPI0022831ED3|nr:hypothetical protein [Bacillus atrophaeus]MCY8499784.1 hypothetical protein [Bacillus atrophaeus]MCY8814949.1 hypothetical protein [Bacillus atrophaeus]MCY8823182.1 hypothetical protein [Bacillus atrophaeus]MCY8831350.1 hypothetical protein [Bacillus atrophaeus]MCY8834846.1 hypothetical protein [Bacillus atrophaeus]
MTKKKRKVFKFNQDDILEILTEHIAKENDLDIWHLKAILLGSSDKDVRLITVIGELDDDDITDIDLHEIDKSINYNSSHSEIE